MKWDRFNLYVENIVPGVVILTAILSISRFEPNVISNNSVLIGTVFVASSYMGRKRFMKRLFTNLRDLSVLLGIMLFCYGCKSEVTPRSPESMEAFISVPDTESLSRIMADRPSRSNMVVSERLVKVNSPFFENNLADKQSNSLKFKIFDTITLQLLTDSIISPRDSVYSWFGKADGEPYSNGSLTFSKGLLFGTVQVDSKIYDFHPVTDSLIRIRIIDQARFPMEAPPIRKKYKEEKKSKTQSWIEEGMSTTIKVLVVLPVPALLEYCDTPSIGNKKDLLTQELQNSLNRAFNAVRPTGVSAVVVSECFPYTPVGGSLDADLKWLASNPDVGLLRNRNQADLVCLMVPFADYCGKGYENFPVVPTASEYGFSVVRLDCAISNYSFAHELGHNLGMAHDRVTDQAEGSPNCNFGSVFEIKSENSTASTKGRCIMSYSPACSGCPRYGVYSNPLTMKDGLFTIGPMGVDCSQSVISGRYTRSNERQQLIEAAPIASRFR